MSEDERVVYEALTSRSQLQDALMWEVPVLGFTAQAFLLTIALGPDSTPVARTLTAAMAAGISFLCVTLMKRHRQLIMQDQRWLNDREKDLGDEFRVNSRKWWAASLRVDVKARHLARWVPTLRGYNTWIVGLSAIALVSLAIIPVAWTLPDWLSTP